MKKLSEIREEYALRSLESKDLAKLPMDQFEKWMEEALNAEVKEPTAFHLSSLGLDGYPDLRVVLLKEIRPDGIVFFTNYQSKKGKSFEQLPRAAANFFWIELQRQVRLVGDIEKISAEDSDAYFHSRPLASQIGAIASKQSEEIESRQLLEKNYQKVASAGKIKRPEHWGGYLLKPKRVEFWQGRKSRLHDRFEYALNSEGGFTLKRLQP